MVVRAGSAYLPARRAIALVAIVNFMMGGWLQVGSLVSSDGATWRGRYGNGKEAKTWE